MKPFGPVLHWYVSFKLPTTIHISTLEFSEQLFNEKQKVKAWNTHLT